MYSTNLLSSLCDGAAFEVFVAKIVRMNFPDGGNHVSWYPFWMPCFFRFLAWPESVENPLYDLEVRAGKYCVRTSGENLLKNQLPSDYD